MSPHQLNSPTQLSSDPLALQNNHLTDIHGLDNHEPRDYFKGGLLATLVGLLLVLAAIMLIGRTVAQTRILLHNNPPSQMQQRLAMLDTPNYTAKPLAFIAPVREMNKPPLTADGLTQLTGIYQQTLEQAELDTGNAHYHVFDPERKLADYAATLGQTSTAMTFPVCLEGAVSSAGDYGHMGRNTYQITVRRVC